MKKVLAVTASGSKAKYISKGYIDAFRKLSYFVYAKKIEDLNINEAEKISADIVFIFWSGTKDDIFIENFLKEYKENSVFIHYAELMRSIPSNLSKLKNHYLFSADAENKEMRIQAVSASELKNDAERYIYKITFAGNPAEFEREKILSELVKNFGAVNIFCRSFDFYKSLDDITEKKLLDENEFELYKISYKGFINKQSELGKIYASSIINLDMISAEYKDINYRTLEITAAGGFAVSPYSIPLIQQFEDGKDLETYKNTEELIDKIRFYLKHTETAERIRERGRKNTAGNFQHYDELKKMLRISLK